MSHSQLVDVQEGLGGVALEGCGLVREGAVDLEVSKAHAQSLCLLLKDQMQALSYCTMPPAMLIMESPSETINKSPVKCSHKLPWPWCLLTAMEQCPDGPR